MAQLKINGVPIEDNYSETFGAKLSRILITSCNRKWALEAATEAKGLGRSATAPPCEASLEREVQPNDTPDDRPGFIIQVMDRKLEQLQKWLIIRIRKGAIPNPQTSVFDALPKELAEEFIDLDGTIIQKFGDGFETKMQAFGREVYRIPRMDGWFHVERKFGVTDATTGGMFLILGTSIEAALESAEKSLEAVGQVDNVIVKCASSGSKVGGTTYTDAVATTNDAYCPTLNPHQGSAISENVKCIYEIIVGGPRLDDVREGMKVGIEAATSIDGILEIKTGNYGGKLGKGKIHLHSLFS